MAGRVDALGRREFLARGALVVGGASLGLGGLPGCGDGGDSGPELKSLYGPLADDPDEVIDLPAGFRYRALSREGERLSDGAPVPGHQDGMAAFRGRDGTTVLVRNHERARGYPGPQGQEVIGRRPYDRGELGGTTAVIVDADRSKVRDFVTSSGTRTNCAGGRTPWGTWLTCEEDLEDGHGYVFEIDPDHPEGKLANAPIEAMGFFSHEAVAIDPRTGIVYLTEDDQRGATSFLYRYLPDDRARRPGALQRGGRLQALAIEEAAANADLLDPRRRLRTVWREVRARNAHDDALRAGAVRFSRLEGADLAGGVLWFADTSGGREGRGQIYRYVPARGTLELFLEGTSDNELFQPDNVVVTPWGDLWFAEDKLGRRDRLMGLTPAGRLYEFARNRSSESELAGPCFAPDGRTLFVNVYSPGMTLAIWGPFERARAHGPRRIATASPPATFGPDVSGELAEAATRHRLTRLEAAAFDRLGVPVV